MSHNSDEKALAILGVFAVFGVLAFTAWKISTTFGLDITTGWAVLVRLLGFIALTVLCWKLGQEFEPLQLGNIWPILLGVLWFCGWPALDYWASQQGPAFFSQEEVSIWWDAWYAKVGGLFGLPSLGYLARELC